MDMQSENISELAMALSKAQGEMQAAIKDSINPFFKSKYADLGSVWDAARPVLCKHGLCVMQTTDVVGDKNILVTILAHSSGQWVKSSILINPTKNDSQGVGAAMTYLRRYSLAAMVGVVTEDDDGETAVGRGQTTERKQEQPKKSEPKTNNLPIPTKSVDKSTCTEKLNNIQHENNLALNQEQIDTIASYLPKLTNKCKSNFFDFFGLKDETELYKIPADKYKGTINSFDLNLNSQNKDL